MHEVHRPALVNGLRHSQRLRLLTNNALLGFDVQIQFQFAVNSIDSFVVPLITLHIPQIKEAQPEAPVALVVCQARQEIGDLNILC